MCLAINIDIRPVVTQQEIQVFQRLLDTMQLTPLRIKGWHFTWCNKKSIDRKVYRKIDWALEDYYWIIQFWHVETDYVNPSI